MNWSLQLVGALILLLPGFAGYIGYRSGSRHVHLNSEERPNSVAALLTVVLLAVCSHAIVAVLAWLSARWCGQGLPCMAVSFDPNPYKALATGGGAFWRSDGAIAAALVGVLVLGLATCLLSYKAGSSLTLRNVLNPDLLGWPLAIADQAADERKVVIVYVLTKLAHDGKWVGYEGLVENVTLGESRQIRSLSLRSADRFIVQLTAEGVERIDTENLAYLELLHIPGEEIANVSFSVVDLARLGGPAGDPA